MADRFRFRLNPSPRDIPTCSALLNGTAKRYHVEGYFTTLSVKSVERGSALYVTPQARHLVTEDSFLILNSGQQYTLDFQGPETTVTICPFFQPGFLEHVAGCTSASAEKLLDDPDPPTVAIEFHEHLYPKRGRVGGILRTIGRRLRCTGLSNSSLEDDFHDLAGGLVSLRDGIRKEIECFPARRRSTREELYRRLHRARDYLSACYHEPVTVTTAARAAHLSPYHFHRTFKLAFGQTPMQFLQACRLAAARRLLQTTDQPVTSICLDVGFESLGSFSWLFRRQFGISPRGFRQRLGRRN